MAKQTINIGSSANDGTGDTIRDGGDKINDNFSEVYGVSGILKSNGSTTLSAAVAGTDYYAPGSTDVAVADGGTGSSTAAGARTNLGLVIGTDVQAQDADLSTIAGLTATTDNFIQSKSSAWASRTPTQVTADLIAMVGDSGSGGVKGLVPAPSAGDAAASKFLKADGTWTAPSGSGDFSSNTSSSVDSEIVLFSGTGGKTGKRATTTGILKGASGVLSAAVAGTDYYNPGGTDVAVADGGTGSSTAGGARTNLGLVIGTDVEAYRASAVQGALTIPINGGGSVITTGVKGEVMIPWGYTITSWDIVADQSGSIVIDLWKDTYANYPPTVADTITGSAKPTLTAATKAQSSTLTGWTTTGARGDYIRWNVDSVSTVTRVTLTLYLTRS